MGLLCVCDSLKASTARSPLALRKGTTPACLLLLIASGLNNHHDHEAFIKYALKQNPFFWALCLPGW